jgi:hypothetical protein
MIRFIQLNEQEIAMAQRAVQVQVLLDPKSLPKLGKIAKAKGVSRSAVIRWAIDDFIASFASADTINRTNTSKETNAVPVELVAV